MKQEFRFLQWDLSDLAPETQTDIGERLAELVRENDFELVLVQISSTTVSDLVTAWTAAGIHTPIIVYPWLETGLPAGPIGNVQLLCPGETLLLEDHDLLIHGGLAPEEVMPSSAAQRLAMLHDNYRNFLIAPPTADEPSNPGQWMGFDHCFTSGATSAHTVIGSVQGDVIVLRPINPSPDPSRSDELALAMV